MLEIKHHDNGNKGKFYIGEDDHQLAKMSYSWSGDIQLFIDHTLVSDEFRGQGVGRQLLDNVIDFARGRNLKIIPLCPYAQSEFDKDASIHDVLK